VGATAALTLAHRGWNRIALVERLEEPSSSSLGKGYTVALKTRGYKIFRELGILDELRSLAIDNDKCSTVVLSRGRPPIVSKPTRMLRSLLLERGTIVRFLYQKLENVSQVHVLRGTEMEGIMAPNPDGLAQLEIRDRVNGQVQVLQTPLILACDGMNSGVRRVLEPSIPDVSLSIFPGKTSHLRYKALSVPLAYQTGDTNLDPYLKLIWLGRGFGRDPDRNAFNLAQWPCGADPHVSRRGCVTLPLDHPIWKVDDLEEMFRIFEENFPHVPVRTLVTSESMQHFISNDGINFPNIQRIRTLAVNVGQSSVVFLGESAHLFPPDFSEGLNSGLEDVYVYNGILTSSQGDVLGASSKYHAARTCDIDALLHVVQQASPFLYGSGRLGQALHAFGVSLLEFLSSRAPQLFTPYSAYLLFEDMSYSEVMRLSNRTRRNLFIAVIGSVSILATATGLLLTSI